MSEWLHDKTGPLYLSLAAVGWYMASIAATAALTAVRDTPGRRALAVWAVMLPIVVLASIIGHYEIVIGMIFASSVASMTLVLGIVTISTHRTQPTLPRKTWGLILPVALICFLIGLHGGFHWIHAVVLLIQGIVIYGLWNDPSNSKPPMRVQTAGPGHRAVLLAVAGIGAVGAAWLAITATQQIGQKLNIPYHGVVTAIMLAPAMVLAMIGLGLHDANEDHYDLAVSGQVGFVLLNLCLTLPLATAIWLSRPLWLSIPVEEAPVALPYPMSVWRVDTIMLVIVGFLLLPVSLGRWNIGKFEGIGLVVIYVVFLMLTVLASLSSLL
ncbi:MAG TPA: hypothetical protein VHD56_16485 [Tepidisphaeraceae bacterium]|nr:hypothetical protein [Tepidisphaeraceae bacterium]